VAKRLQAAVLNSEGRTSGELAKILKAPRSRVSEYLSRYHAYGVEGLWKGTVRDGRHAGRRRSRSDWRTFWTVVW
jgi:predicted transcriptional regulator